jgi:hypothetical protein
MYGEMASVKGFIGAALSIAKPQLGALIMAAAGVAIVFSISMFALIARPLFLVAALLGRVRQEAQGPPRTQRSTEWRLPSRSVSRRQGHSRTNCEKPQPWTPQQRR